MTIFGILGELELEGVDIGGRRRRGLLALLLGRAGEMISLDRICDELWDGSPTAGSAGTVRTYLSQFRKLDLPMTISSDTTGYGISFERTELDATLFEDLVSDARSHNGDERLLLLDEALSLWRGPAFAEFRGARWADDMAHPLEALRRRTLADRLELLAELGRLEEAVHGLEAAVAADPLDERLGSLLALSRYRSGRVAEALRGLGSLRRSLSEELGIDPGPEITELERRILDRDPSLDAQSEGPVVLARQSDAAGLPSGTVTFLFTDIVGSTALLQRVGDETYAELLGRHRQLVTAAVTGAAGHVFGTEGDANFAVFADAAGACEAAHEIVRVLAAEPWTGGHEVRVRAGLHTGQALLVDGDYAGATIHLAARVASTAHAEQIVASDTTVALSPGVDWHDLGVHRLKDIERPQRIHQLVASDIPSVFPPLPTARNVPTNLPETHDAFVGRNAEIEAVASSIASGSLTSLVGPGGVGKTRLAVESARRTLSDHPGGVHFVPLAGVDDTDGVEPALRRAMSLPDRSGLDLAGAVNAATAGEGSLVVLDNCEHVVAGVAGVASALIQGCPAVRVLCTSREPLQIRGERVRWVQPLGTSDGAEMGPAEELFLIRAEAATGRPVPGTDLPLVSDLVRELDGLPLAIELAAARTRGLAIVDIVHRLDDRFRLLRSGHRGADDRHRTLESVVAWSHELLTPPDRALLNRLSVFRDSFSLSVAEEICTDGDVDTVDVLDGISRLVEKSLVQFEAEESTSRYRLLETIRRFSLERLDQAGQRASFEARLVDWVLALVDRLERDMRTERQDATIREATAERDVALTALAIVLADGRNHDALRIVASVPVDVPSERIRLIETLVSSVGSEYPGSAGRAHLAAANLAFEMGANDQAVGHADAARRMYTEMGDTSGAAWGSFLEAFATWASGDRERSHQAISTALSEFAELGDAVGLANASWMRATLEEDLDQAERLADDAERRCRAIHAPTALAHCLEVRALIALRRDDARHVSDWLQESLGVFVGLRHEGCTAHVLEAVAAASASGHSDPSLVAELLGGAARLREMSGHSHRPWELAGHSAAISALATRLDEAELQQAIERGRGHTLDSAVAAARRLLDHDS